jgi:hypothetical protein
MMERAIGESVPGLKFEMTSPGLAKNSQGPAFELKFKLTLAEAEFVEAWARAHLLPDCHGADGFYQVTSVYCDTTRFDVFHRNPGFKRRKFRLRRYGEALPVFLERKSRLGDRVRKKRVEVTSDELCRLAETQTDPEWAGAWFHQRILKRDLRPSVRVSYERTAFFGGAAEAPVRLTLDRNLVGVAAHSWDIAPVRDGLPLLQGAVLLEMKYHITVPEKFRDLLSRLPAQPARLSKYRHCVNQCGLAAPRALPGPQDLRSAAS